MKIHLYCFAFALFNLYSETYTLAQFSEANIGTQVWMDENLNVSSFRNGQEIFEAKTVDDLNRASNAKSPAWCYYNFDSSNNSKFGKLYNWYAVNDSRGLAPIGWHIPTAEEWTALLSYLGIDLYYMGYTHPVPTNQKLPNSLEYNGSGQKLWSSQGWSYRKGLSPCGFNAIPGGYYYGGFKELNSSGIWYTSSSGGTYKRPIHFSIGSYGIVTQNDWGAECMFSVRCVKNEQSKTIPYTTQRDIKRDPDSRKDFVNVFYNPSYTLFDLWSDEPIFPTENGIYLIYYATNENKKPTQYTGSAEQLSKMLVYKFKDFNNCSNWCNGVPFMANISASNNDWSDEKKSILVE